MLKGFTSKHEVNPMTDNYARIVRDNLEQLDWNDLDELAGRLPARPTAGGLAFRAFGHDCLLSEKGILLGGRPETGPMGILISLYALHCQPDPAATAPLRAFNELPGSQPYVGAFANRTEAALTAHVDGLIENLDRVKTAFDGAAPPPDMPGDAAVILWPLPKIALCYLLYRSDEDFPAAATCLFSANAGRFLPTDALADLGEYTSRRLVELVGG
jgi:hypothetical protein